MGCDLGLGFISKERLYQAQNEAARNIYILRIVKGINKDNILSFQARPVRTDKF